jgi:uncharacterized repeat protein (TIGR01451 family)
MFVTSSLFLISKEKNMKPRFIFATVLSLTLVVALIVGLTAATASATPTAAPDFHPASVGENSLKALVDNSAAATLKQLPTLGGQLLQDYGSFSLWAIPGTQTASVADSQGLTLQPDFDKVELRGSTINTQADEPAVPANLRETAGAGKQFWMVQFAGPIKSDWLTQLQSAGLEVVIYMPNNAYVVWGEAPQAKLTALAARNSMVQWTGAYHPAYRLSPALQEVADKGAAGEWVNVTVQFYTTSATPDSVTRLLKLGGEVKKSTEQILGFTNISLQIPADKLIEQVNQADVFNVEPWAAPQQLDEVQNQILAGNVISSGGAIVPNSPGYIAWLATKGFPTTPASYPIVDIVDDGIDQGNAANVLHPDFHELGVLANPDRVIYIGNCTTDATGNGVAGHGNLNAGIVGAYNNLAGVPYVDANGYRIGLGVSPYGHVAGTKIFNNAGSYSVVNCSGTDQGVVAASYNSGAQFTSNSWGADVGGTYDSSSQAYDQLTRDASSTTGGNQEMLHVFAAGNAGSSANTVGSPATAKNVLSVAATENVRDQGVIDGCSESAANNADDMATFSSRGPTDDGRYKPEISAPGTHVQGPASQDPGYNGTGVCGGPGGTSYYPASQTLYTWSSGTSHSTPAIAGTASLVWNYYGRVLKPSATPSPAMLKALLLNSTRYLQGLSTGDTLPSNSQGWGDANLGTLFDGTPRVIVDQSQMFTATGQQQLYYGSVADPGKPFRVTLAWTDAPGSTTGNSYVNNLDLEVTVNGVTYKGNVFSGPDSIVGGTADVRNNVESVFLPAGAGGSYTVRVVATNLAGDGVPGTGTATDQDYALVIYNNLVGPSGTLQGQVRNAVTAAGIAAAQVSISAVPTQTYNLVSDGSGNYSILLPVDTYTVTASAFGYQSATVSGVPVVSGTTTTQDLALNPLPALAVTGVLVSGGDGDAILEPGETANLSVGVGNIGFLTATNVSGVLTSTNVLATVSSGSSLYADIAPSATVTNTTLFQVKLDGGFVCGQPLQLNLTISTTQGIFPLIVNVPTSPPNQQTTYVSTDVPKSVPDNSTVGVTSLLTVTDNYVINDVNVKLSINHSFDADLDIYLVSPTGITVELSTDNGSSGDNYINTIFDDQAATSITAGTAPFTGSYKPESPLSVLNGQSSAGTWKLFVQDDLGGDLGTITAWSLALTAAPVCNVPVPLLTRNGQTYSDAGGNNDGLIFPGENNLTAKVGVLNSGTAAATGTNGVLTALTPGVTVITNTAAYGTIGIGALVTNSVDFGFNVASSVACGADLTFGFTANANEGSYNTGAFSFPTGVKQTAAYTNSTALPIPDNAPPVLSTITVPASPRTVADVKVLININHTWDADLDIFLISPLGTRVELSTDNGSSGDNYVNTIFDDAAATSITAGTAPFTGSYRPETPLSAVDGQTISGDWKLEVADDEAALTGTLLNWSLIIQTIKCADAPALTLNKTASASTIQPGQQLTYTLVTRNTGEPAATGVVLSDTLPGNVTYVSSSDGGVLNGGVVTWTVGAIPSGINVTRTLTVEVNVGVSNGTILSNTFTALSTELPAQTSNTAATVVVVPAQLTVNVVGNGTVNQNPLPPYGVGDVVTLTAIPDAGWNFAGWSGDLSGTTNPITITLTGDKTVTATFVHTVFLPLITK